MASRISETYRTAFVTGASTGLGRAFSEMLLAEGVHVWGTSRDVGRLHDLTTRFTGAFTPVQMELRNGDLAAREFQSCDEAAGGFDLVINNAGYSVFGEFAETDFALWREQLEVMLVNTARLSHEALASMRRRAKGEKRCALVNISSLAAEFPIPFQSVYNVCKAGLSALNESLMIEYQGTNIVILDVRPGDYRTDFEGSVRMEARPAAGTRLARAWDSFAKMMNSGPLPVHAAEALRRALLRGRSGTLRTGRFFQAGFAPFIARFGSLSLRRRIQAYYFDVH